MARTRASDFEEKQHSILKSAAAVLAEQGMDKASMAQIANHCQVSKALLYHYYPSKNELLFAIIHTHLVELEAALAAATDERARGGGSAARPGGRGAAAVPGRRRRP